MLAVAGKLINGGRKRRVTGKSAVLRTVNHLPRMFNSCADGKRLLNHKNALVMKHFHRVARRVTYCKNDCIGFKIKAF